ncbi:MAG: tetratricopeptide repeat protein [Methanobacteriota archaeon]|nr:MAG: tetratricopeptide repeat protein [Euryarchaeota archaeon]
MVSPPFISVPMDPLFSEYWYHRGQSLYEAQRHEDAISCYDLVLRVDGRDVRAWKRKGFILLKLGRIEEAARCFREAVDLAPHDSPSWRRLAFALGKMNRIDDALGCCDRALEIDPGSTAALQHKGWLLELQQRYDGAVACYDRILGIDAGHGPARDAKERAQNCATMQDLERFVLEAEKVVTIPENVYAILRARDYSQIAKVLEALSGVLYPAEAREPVRTRGVVYRRPLQGPDTLPRPPL